ncbi:MAG: M24 family metallopeptidase, partial [Thermoplasmata archaeon]
MIQTGSLPFVDLTFFYVTGLSQGVMEGSTAILHPDGSVRILTSVLEAETARSSGLPVTTLKSKEDREKKLKRLLRGTKKIGINAAGLTHRGYLDIQKKAPKAELVDVSEAVIKARLVKDSKELRLLKRAARIGSEVAKEIIPFIDIGVKEHELGSELNYLMEKKGSSGPFFETIASSGPNTAEPHYSVGNRKIQRRDFVLLDYGATYKKYGCDITRT